MMSDTHRVDPYVENAEPAYHWDQRVKSVSAVQDKSDFKKSTLYNEVPCAKCCEAPQSPDWLSEGRGVP